MKLIDNWQQCYKLHSQRALAVIAALQAVIMGLPDDWRAMPAIGHYSLLNVMTALTLATTILGAVGRILAQEAPQEAPQETPAP